MNKHFSVLFAILVMSPCAFAGVSPMQPGKWRITTKIEMAGMPTTIPPVTHTICYSKKDIKQHKAVPLTHPNCTREYYRVEGNTMLWKMACRGKGAPVTMTGKMTSTGTSYRSKMTTESAHGRMVTILSGTRIGNCN